MATPLEHLTKLNRLRDGSWLGQRSWLATTGETPGFMEAIENSKFPGVSGDKAPRAITSVALFNPPSLGRPPGKSIVVVDYETPREPERARLQLRSFGLKRKRVIDLDGNVMEGPDPKDPRNRYRITEGLNEEVVRVGLAVLSTAATAESWVPQDAMQLMNTVNEDPTPQILDAKSQELWMVDIRQQQVFGGALVYTDYLMGWVTETADFATRHPGVEWAGWNSQSFSQLGTDVVYRIPVLNQKAQTDTGDTRELKVFLPDQVFGADNTLSSSRTIPVVNRVKEAFDWGFIDAKTVFFV